jgi:hypothetical protein
VNQELPSFLEDHISQIPALQLLQNLGWEYLTPGETVALRGGKLSGAIRLPISWRRGHFAQSGNFSDFRASLTFSRSFVHCSAVQNSSGLSSNFKM